MAKKKRARRRVRRCEVCRCTDNRACPGGCWWDPRFAALGRDVCSECTGEAKP